MFPNDYGSQYQKRADLQCIFNPFKPRDCLKYKRQIPINYMHIYRRNSELDLSSI